MSPTPTPSPLFLSLTHTDEDRYIYTGTDVHTQLTITEDIGHICTEYIFIYPYIQKLLQ